MRLKHFLLSFLLFFVVDSTIAQVIKFRATGFATKQKSEITENWGAWSEMKKSDALIVIDFTKNRIKIFSQEEQVYDIIKYYDMEHDTDLNEILKFHCVNEDGIKCFVRFMTRVTQNRKKQLYVDFANLILVYNLTSID